MRRLVAAAAETESFLMDGEKISVLDDVVEHVRRRRLMYLGGDVVLPAELVAKLVSDALTVGAQSVEARRYRNWWMVSSDKDWLMSEGDLEDPFTRIVPLPGGGREAFHRAILLTAFASCVFTRKGHELRWIVGEAAFESEDLQQYLAQVPEDRRVVGFKLEKQVG